MTLINNLEALTQTHYDSGSLGGLASVLHRLTETGQHPVTILQTDKVIRTTLLTVQGALTPKDGATTAGFAASVPHAESPGPNVPTELHVDLSNIAHTPGQQSQLTLAGLGYAVFYATAGTSGFAVQMHAPDAPDKPPVFDSRQLGNGDVFATTMFRPGRYLVTNKVNNTQARIRVSYPVIGNTPYSPPDALVVQLDAQGFAPKDIQLQPAQGVVFHTNNTSARIAIDLTEADDGPVKLRMPPILPPVGRILPDHLWVKPEEPKTSEN